MLEILGLAFCFLSIFRVRELSTSFFVLSGFIFFWLYGARIRNREIGGWAFFVLRMSRLYPLHLATLLFVAGAQWIYVQTNGQPFGHGGNDTRHFALNMLFAHRWGLESGSSFNGPAWSISVEIFLYAAFFLVTRFSPLRAAPILLLVVIGLQGDSNGSNLYCLGAFFVGGLTYIVYRRALGIGWIELGLRVTLLVMWSLTMVSLATEITLNTFAPTYRLDNLFAVAFLFPLTVLYLALAETRLGSLWKSASWLGDVSYSTYLLHFPLQLVCALFLPLEIFGSPIALVSFLGVLLLLSYACHKYFEMPAQKWIRNKARTLSKSTQGSASVGKQK
ncbi:MAG: acyltransferase [Rhodocyclaceae bacterium]|nr:acyltransferase [Rhodocyclaceae bacterium]